MRDIIWTLIVVWLIYKLVDVFKAVSSPKKEMHSASQQRTAQSTASTQAHTHSERDIKNAIQKHLNKEGEYVDFEEVK